MVDVVVDVVDVVDVVGATVVVFIVLVPVGTTIGTTDPDPDVVFVVFVEIGVVSV